MIFNLQGKNREKIIPLIKNTRHELSVECVIYNTSPGEVYADDENKPNSCFIKAPECNVFAGNPDNRGFNEEIKKNIDYWDQITCDTNDWEKVVFNLHPNIALRKYKRKYYDLSSTIEKCQFAGDTDIEFIYPDMLQRIKYENNELVTEWNNIVDAGKYSNLCLAALKIQGNMIVACSAVDCFSDNKIEIGINTLKDYRNKGYGSFLSMALVNESIKNGILKIGWHCVSTNVGSQKIAEKCGFKNILDYDSFTPYPPIENKTDLTKSQWEEYARFFQEKGKLDINQYWQAARCWAYAEDLKRSLACVNKLAEQNIYWFLDYISTNEEFGFFRNEPDWIKAIEGFKSENS